MKSSEALGAHRGEIRRIVVANRGRSLRVFGSVLHQDDTEVSELDLLIDAAEGMTHFDTAAITSEIERLTHTKVDLKPPKDLSAKFRSPVIAEARLISRKKGATGTRLNRTYPSRDRMHRKLCP